VETLNSLQSNAAVLEKARLQNNRHALGNVPFTEKYLNRIGIPMEMIDKLNVIHVSGTKVTITNLLTTITDYLLSLYILLVG